MLIASVDTTWIALSAVATLLLALATFAFVVAAFRQLPILRLTQQDTTKSANAAVRAARAAEDALSISREQIARGAEQVDAARKQNELASQALQENITASA